MKVAFVPIDNRPVCYTLPKLIASIDGSVEFFMPERKVLGDLEKSADISELFIWLMSLPKLDAIVLSLDTLAYGGLIPSRRCPETFEEIKTRVMTLKEILEEKQAKIYAFSSIMRISNNNINQEEKEYWAQWGKEIFKYSYNMHKAGSLECLSKTIPSEILDDYIETRRRNFEINKLYLQWQKEGLIDTLIFSKDDCAQYGFNVQEAQFLEKMGGFVKTGADEIPISLLARAIEKPLKICPIFCEEDYKHLISNYEDISVEKSVKGQIELCGCEISDENSADILLYVNNFIKNQGEIVMKQDTTPFDKTFIPPQKPYMIADVRFANGSDNNFVKEFMKTPIKFETFYGYGAWNTTANTLGSLICAAKMKYCAQNFDSNAFKNLQITRLLDDWAYQANVRQMLQNPDVDKLNDLMKNFTPQIETFLDTKFSAEYSFPWNRLFEVEVNLNNCKQ